VSRRHCHRARGQVLPLAALAMIALVGMLAIVVDGGMFWEVRRDLQSGADAAVLAGVVMLPGSPTDAVNQATAYAANNARVAARLCAQAPTTVATPGWDAQSQVYTLTVTVSCPTGYTFGRILNLFTPMTVSASATAALGSVSAAACPFPLLIEEAMPGAYAFADASGAQIFSSITPATTTYGYHFGPTDYDRDGKPGYSFELTTGRPSPLATTPSEFAQTASDTVITPQVITDFPLTLPFTIWERQTSEAMLVTSVTGSTWKVQRGVAGTTAQPIKAGDDLDYDPDFGLLCVNTDGGGCGASSSGGTPGFADWLAQNPCAPLQVKTQTLRTPGGGGAQGAMLGSSGKEGLADRPPTSPAYTISGSVATCTAPPSFGPDGVTVTTGSACIGAFPIARTGDVLNLNGSKPVQILGFAPFYLQTYDASKSTATISGQFVKVKFSARLGAYDPGSIPIWQLIR
jgi:hypothetical protein